MRFPNNDILVFTGMADACAAATEYVAAEHAHVVTQQSLNLRRYVERPLGDLPAGNYTDDTEMAVAVAKVLLGPGPFTAEQFAHAFVLEFNRGGRRRGYAKAFHAFLCDVQDGPEFMRRINPGSKRNGAAMRAAPIGVLPDIAQVLDVAEVQASVTHNTPEGIFSAQMVALMSHYALYERGPLSYLPDYCREHLPKDFLTKFGHIFREHWSGKPVGIGRTELVAIETVHAVLDVIVNSSTLIGMLLQAMRWGGDTDSVASIAWGVASARFQNDSLPAFLERDLEGGSHETGAAHLRNIGTQLMSTYAAKK